MTDMLLGWSTKGFSGSPTLKTSPAGGMQIYRCWGGTSTEWGNPQGGSYFSLHKPASALDAELRFNIADWGNQIQFVSTFLLSPGTQYWEGSVLHRKMDMSRPAAQVYVEGPVLSKMKVLVSTQPLTQDVWVSPRAGNA